MELIDKAALVAEIERQQRKLCLLSLSNNVELRRDAAIQNGVYCSLLPFINTLEVKEVDIDEAARKWEDKVYLEKGRQDEYGTPHVPFSEIGNAFMEGAKFILKAQKGE